MANWYDNIDRRGYGLNNTTVDNDPNWWKGSAGSVGHWNYQPQETPVEEEVVPQLNPLDANWQHQLRMQNIDRGKIDNRGFNFPSMWGAVKGGLEWLGEKFKRPDAKQAEWDALRNITDQYGTYRGGTLPTGQEAMIVDGKISVRAPDGTILLRDKNFDSMFGSGSVAEMIQKKEDWAKEDLTSTEIHGLMMSIKE